MRAYIQPSFGFPSDPILVAYVVIILSDGKRFEISEDSHEGAALKGVRIRELDDGERPPDADEMDNEQ